MTRPDNAPSPIRTDENYTFANHTMRVRVPETIKQIRERNARRFPASVLDGLQRLGDQIVADAPVPMLSPLAPDYADWLPQWEALNNPTWLNTVWFFAETYFYRQVIEITRWWENGQDPFAPNKQAEYESEALWELVDSVLVVSGNSDTALHATLSRALWGNRVDLSYAESQQFGTAVNADDLLVNDTNAAVSRLLSGVGPVHIIADNAGTELAMDIVLADQLLTRGVEVVMHLKMHPTFVSDAIPADVLDFLWLLEDNDRKYGAFHRRLKSALDTGRWRLIPNLFWNSSYFLWELPAHLREALANARMVIVKGDANYRRILGDALWDPATPFADAMRYFPAPLLALRTLKSDPIVGLPPGKATELDAIDERWRYSGKRGLIQYYQP